MCLALHVNELVVLNELGIQVGVENVNMYGPTLLLKT